MTKILYDAIRGSSGTADSIQLHASNQSVTFPGATTFTGAMEIPNDTVDIADLSASGTASSSTFLCGDNSWTAVTSGLTAFDSWRVNSNISNDATPITSNWERDDSTNGFHASNQMSESSGTFSFPATGIWYIYFGAYGYSSSDNDHIQSKITYTADNGTYHDAARSYSSMNNDDGGNLYMHSNVSTMFDVSNTTNCKIRFHLLNLSSMTHECSSSINQVYAHFMKLGET